MVFYKIEAFEKQGEEKRKDQTRFRYDVCGRTRSYNRGRDSFIFLSGMEDGVLTFGLIASEDCQRHVKLAEYCDLLNLELDDFRVEETTGSEMVSLLRSASRLGLIDDDEQVADNYRCSVFKNSRLSERMAEKVCRAVAMNRARSLLYEETLGPELDRIFRSRRKAKAYGHPVHYLVSYTDKSAYGTLVDTILGSLCYCNRLKSRRYTLVYPEMPAMFERLDWKELYEGAVGSTVVSCFRGNVGEDTDLGEQMKEMALKVTEMTEAFSNRVLTLILVPSGADRLKNYLLNHLTNTVMVDIRENRADEARAYEYLDMLSREAGIKPDETLHEKVEKGRSYAAPELKQIWDRWYSDTVRRKYFPAYADLNLPEKKADLKPKGSAYEELCRMIGLGRAKEVINKAVDFFHAQKLLGDRGFGGERPALSMVFTGNPGTAKTTVARLLASILKDNGILPVGDLVEVGRGDIVGKYVGHTAPKVQYQFKKAQGSVLFIDEAYSLVDDRDGLYGDEAINTIVQEMENHRGELAVIFAGYPDKMEQFLSKNPGLRSRIAFHVHFDDYNPEELCRITEYICTQQGLMIEPEALDYLNGVYAEIVKNPEFGNGRYVRNLIERARMNQASRLIRCGNVDGLTDEDVKTLKLEDLALPELIKDEPKRSIGFSA